MTTYIQLAPCPFCGQPNDAQTATEADSNPPHAGALAMCWGCRCIGVFEDGPDGLEIRKPTPAELEEIAQNEHVQRIVQAMGMNVVL
jgi:hypothetical protein